MDHNSNTSPKMTESLLSLMESMGREVFTRWVQSAGGATNPETVSKMLALRDALGESAFKKVVKADYCPPREVTFADHNIVREYIVEMKGPNEIKEEKMDLDEAMEAPYHYRISKPTASACPAGPRRMMAP